MKKSSSSLRDRPGGLSYLLLLAVLPVASAQLAPAAETANANLPAQRIGANDLVAVSVYDAPELTRTVRVGADGLMRLPMRSEERRVGKEGRSRWSPYYGKKNGRRRGRPRPRAGVPGCELAPGLVTA